MKTYLILFLLVCCTQGSAQSTERFAFRSVVFYNVENLFDTTNDSLVWDDERTPEGRYHWTRSRYETKLNHISKVIRSFKTPQGSTILPDVIGVCEVENRKVLDDLVAHPELESLGYDLVHYDSPDKRGIDVALLYRNESFTPTSFQSRRLLLFEDDGIRQYTRDQLVVGGYLDG
ncbi:MAG: endonuclease/exonuclease/phosphatase family protein, partial [Bacteroidota bacterium]